MRRLFRAVTEHPYIFRGHRAVQVPGVICDVCRNTWASTDVTFPRVEFVPSGRVDARAEPWAEFDRIRREIVDAVPSLAGRIEPGTGLGSFRVEAVRGRLPACWSQITDGFFVRDDLWAELDAAGFGLVGLPVLVDPASGKAAPPAVELELPYFGAQPAELRTPAPAPCTQCGWMGGAGVGWHGTVIEASVPEDVHVFRFAEHTTIIIVSEPLRDFLSGRRAVRMTFEEIQVV